MRLEAPASAKNLRIFIDKLSRILAFWTNVCDRRFDVSNINLILKFIEIEFQPNWAGAEWAGTEQALGTVKYRESLLESLLETARN